MRSASGAERCFICAPASDPGVKQRGDGLGVTRLAHDVLQAESVPPPSPHHAVLALLTSLWYDTRRYKA